MPRKARLKLDTRVGNLDIASELERLSRIIMSDIERIRRREEETGDIIVNKYLYYEQANRILGQLILLKYKYNASQEDPWETLARVIEDAGEAGVGGE